MSYERVKKQIAKKPAKLARFVKHNSSKKRKFGNIVSPCRQCGKKGSIMHKYGLNYCRQCFREEAEHIGFKKFN